MTIGADSALHRIMEVIDAITTTAQRYARARTHDNTIPYFCRTYSQYINCKIKLCLISAVISGHLCWKWWDGIVGKHYFIYLLMGPIVAALEGFIWSIKAQFMPVSLFCSWWTVFHFNGLGRLVSSNRLMWVWCCILMCCGGQVPGCSVSSGIWCWLGLYSRGSSRGRVGGPHVCTSGRGKARKLVFVSSK